MQQSSSAPVLQKVQLQRLAEELQKQRQPSVEEERLRGLVCARTSCVKCLRMTCLHQRWHVRSLLSNSQRVDRFATGNCVLANSCREAVVVCTVIKS